MKTLYVVFLISVFLLSGHKLFTVKLTNRFPDPFFWWALALSTAFTELCRVLNPSMFYIAKVARGGVS